MNEVNLPPEQNPGLNLSARGQNDIPPADTSLKYRIRNQLISGYSFLPTVKCSIIFSLTLGVILIGLGVGVLLISNTVTEVSQRYDDICGMNQPDCSVKIKVPTTIQKPVYFYLQVSNFYQNHRLYVKSYSSSQLLGEDLSLEDAQDKCKPVVRNSDISSTLTSLNGTTLRQADVANPCGLIAKSFISDNFTLYTPSKTGTLIPIRQTGIAWSVDIERKFKRNKDSQTKQYIDVENERFINWMSFSTLYYWKKLWGIIDQDLPAGEYEFIVANYYDVLKFEGEKAILLSNASVLGGTSALLAMLLLIMGGLYVALAVMILLYKWFKKSPPVLTLKDVDFSWD